MKCTVHLTEAERLTLQQLALNHRHRDIRTRATGVLHLARGLKPKEIAAEIGVSHQSLYNWAKAWREAGLCGLLVGHNGGRGPALSPEMVATAVAAAREESMTLARIAQRVEAEHGMPLPCTLETLSKALKGAGLTYKRARFSLKKSATPRPLP